MLETLGGVRRGRGAVRPFHLLRAGQRGRQGPRHTRTTLDRAQAVESLCRNGLWDVTAWNKLYRLDLFRQIRYPEGLLYEDTATTYLITQECDRVAGGHDAPIPLRAALHVHRERHHLEGQQAGPRARRRPDGRMGVRALSRP